ncbi:PREDICTED: putative serine carboxypeptidase-like 23 [Branchiostoma belcheri]|uniref:Carboxypeptidase n=1 Tax=Branchiostoma belcheri TaxID=7741 RepID=A0A6P5A3K9_BRABE|nr:PREDICTED: putative serine carboxypeptidase-like 23 [Branchiostoma belcheri]
MGPYVCLFAIFLATCPGQAFSRPETPDSDKIESLPGLNATLPFSQYAGYITVNQSHGRRLFYWFVESQNDPARDPLVLWLNGGPGCSSFNGLFEENGPFSPNPDGKTLDLNPYSWNRNASVIFLESPSGVGFSYSDTTADYTTGDWQTAQDSLDFMLKFLEKYPQYQKNKFWITGESYAGHYVPNLASHIVSYNTVKPGSINLEGFMVGNAWTDPDLDNAGATFFWWSHALISDRTYNSINKACNYSNIGPLLANGEQALLSSSPGRLKDECEMLLAEAHTEMGNINIYNIYVDVCLRRRGGRQLLSQLARSDSVLRKFAQRRLEAEDVGRKMYPCEDDYMEKYLNRPDVIATIHAATLPYKWTPCSTIVDYSRKDLLTSMLPVYKRLFTAGLRILVYSGDVDAIVPVTGTRAWLRALPLTEVEGWSAWTASDQQVGGYSVVYDKLTFATVRNAGHEVPGYQPLRALDMFNRFLTNQRL